MPVNETDQKLGDIEKLAPSAAPESEPEEAAEATPSESED